jgi:hypothetical protein
VTTIFPAAVADTETLQLDWAGPEAERTHAPPVTPAPETVTVPEGADGVPVASVSVTVAVAVDP